jgi:hypothetical protein
MTSSVGRLSRFAAGDTDGDADGVGATLEAAGEGLCAAPQAATTAAPAKTARMNGKESTACARLKRDVLMTHLLAHHGEETAPGR